MFRSGKTPVRVDRQESELGQDIHGESEAPLSGNWTKIINVLQRLEGRLLCNLTMELPLPAALQKTSNFPEKFWQKRFVSK